MKKYAFTLMALLMGLLSFTATGSGPEGCNPEQIAPEPVVFPGSSLVCHYHFVFDSNGNLIHQWLHCEGGVPGTGISPPPG